MKQDHRPWDYKQFHRGANTDAEPQAVAKADGTYRDAQNMRLADDAGSGGSLTEIGGESQIAGPLQPGADTYHCLGAITVFGRRFAVWASDQPQLYAPLIRIDGITMVMSSQLPYVWDRPIQLHMTEDCEGGMVFDARSGGIPLHWKVQDIVDAFQANLQTYFTGFDVSAYQVNPVRPVNRPSLLQLEYVGTGNGLSGGQVWYVTRYVNATGDRTPDSPPLGPVFIPFYRGEGWDGVNSQRPWPNADLAGMTTAQVGVPTGWGPKLRLRINNTANFESMELVRIIYNENAGPDALAEVQVAARFAVQPGENRPHDIIDTGQVLDAISDDENLIRTHFIKEANSVRYINFRVVYGGVLLGAQDVQGQWLDQGGVRVFPITQSIGREGHADPVNACYFRRFQSGERQAVGAVYWDSVGGNSYVDIIDPAYQCPNRRDEKADDSLANSSHRIDAANVDHEVTPTFELFDLDNAVRKSQNNQVVNIMSEARRHVGGSSFAAQAISNGPTNIQSNFITFAGEPYPLANDGVFIDNAASGGPHMRTDYTKPLTPQQGAISKWGLDYLVNLGVHINGAPNSPALTPYAPKVFAPTQHALGAAVYGIAQPPVGTQGMSIVTTPRAGRVVAQGFAKWVLTPGDDPLDPFPQAGKEAYRLHVCIPDYNAGVLNQEIWEGILAADGRYKAQLVSPLGIVSEQFGSVMGDLSPTVPIPIVGSAPATGIAFSGLSDMLSYARVLWDTGQCNPWNNSGGYTPPGPLPGNPDHFVGYDSWRSAPRPNSPWHQPGVNGNRILGYNNAQEIVHAPGQRSVILSMDEPIYNALHCNSTDFSSLEAKGFHEPFYVINFVQDAVQVDDQVGFSSNNSYVPWVSFVGTTDGTPGQQFLLVDERLDDVWSDRAGQERFVFVLGPNGPQPYLYVAPFLTDYTIIEAAINADGFWVTPGGVTIFGLYDVFFGVSRQDAWIEFLALGFPAEGRRVEVRYNEQVPFKFFGDMFQAPAMATMFDFPATANPQSYLPSSFWTRETGTTGAAPRFPKYSEAWYSGQWFKTSGLPIPFANYEYNGNYMVPFGKGWGSTPGGAGANGSMAINQHRHGTIVSLRQWKFVFDCEVSANLFMSQYLQPGILAFPFTNYQQHPYNFLPNASPDANGVALGYGNHYSLDYGRWVFGGIQSRQEPLPDYNIRPGPQYFKLDEFGYIERTRQCAAVVYSAKAPPITNDLPGLRTFPVNNIEYIEPTRGSIQRLYSAVAGTGYNLYAVTEKGVRLVLSEQNIGRSSTGSEFGVFGNDLFVAGQLWIPGAVGMPGNTWMTAAEGSPFAPGTSYRTEALGWSDGDSYHLLMGNQVHDIAKGVFRKAIRDGMATFTSLLLGRLSGAYDQSRDEFYLGTPGRTLVFAAGKGLGVWQGGYSYSHDAYQFANGRMYGMRDLADFLLDEGDVVNGQQLQSWVKIPSAPFPGERMQWMRVKIDSPRKPKRVEFYDEFDQLACWLDAPFALAHGFPDWTYLKKVTNWENLIPSTNVAVNPQKPKLQGALAYYRIIFEDAGPDKIVRAGIQVKPLK